MALSARLQVQLAATLTKVMDVGSGHDAKDQLPPFEKIFSVTNGTGAGQGDMLWHDQRTLAASATENLDLAGSLADAFGTTQTFVRVNLIIVYAAEGNTNDVQVQRGSSNGVPLFMAASDGVQLSPGMIFVLGGGKEATDFVVTAGTGDILTITNSAGSTSVTYDVLILGASA